MLPLIDIIFPKICLSCNREGSHVCEDCLSLISLNATPSQVSRSSPLSGLFAATTYQNKRIQYLIRACKYPPFLRDLTIPLASLIISHFALMDKQDIVTAGDNAEPKTSKSTYVVCPIPLHKKRLKWRGYNQAEEMAQYIAEMLRFPIYSDVLMRTRNTSPQTELSGEKRRENMKDAFSLQHKEYIQNKKILLVDDVYTTGASMEEAARTLKQAGAKQIFGVVVARG